MNMKRILVLLTTLVLLNYTHDVQVLTSAETTTTQSSSTIFSYAQEDTTAWNLTADGTLTISGIGRVVDRLPYSYDSMVLKLVIEDGITEIDAHCFSNLPNLETVTFSDTIQSIGVSAFSGCTSLESITFNEGLETIGKYAFGGCTNLESVTLPSTLTDIGTSAFQRCTSLTALNCNLGLERIDDFAFSDCSSLSRVTLSNTVKYIGEHAFTTGYSHYWVSSLSYVVVPKSVKYIGEGAFGVNYVQYGESAIVYPIEGFTLYGYSGSVAEEYVESTNTTIENQPSYERNIYMLEGSNSYNLLRFIPLEDDGTQLNPLELLTLKKSSLTGDGYLLTMLRIKYDI
jgi:hypothetical protein